MTAQEQTSDDRGIRAAIDKYARGMEMGNVEIMRGAFHDQAILCGYLGDDLIAAPIQGLFDWVGSNPPPEEFSFLIVSVEIIGRVAAAKARETDSHGTVIDHFHLLKEGDDWRSVSKLWDSE